MSRAEQEVLRLRSRRIAMGSAPCWLYLGAFLAALFLLARPAAALDLEDLNVPSARVRQPNGDSRWRPPPTIPDTSSWTVINASAYMGGCSTADNGTDDEPCVDAAYAAAEAVSGGVVLYFAAGVYNFQGDETLAILRSNMVIRCESPETTTLKWHAGAEGICGNGDWGIGNGYESLGGICGDERETNSVSWTGGYGLDGTVLQVSSTAGYQAGDWIVARAEAPTECYEGDLFEDVSLMHMAKVVSVGSGTLTIDRPLKMDYAADPDCAPLTIKKPTAIVRNSGFENCTFAHANPTDSSYGFKPLVSVYATSGAWVTGSRFGPHYNRGTSIAYSRDALIEGNDYSNIGYIRYNTGAADVAWGATDSYVVNNTFSAARVASYMENGPEGTVVAYNFTVGDAGCERSHFMHGKYTRETLIEGNDGDCAIQADSRWGRQGPRNTLYRNRHRQPTVTRTLNMSLWSPATHNDEGAGCATVIADYLTLIGNSGRWFVQGPNWVPTPNDSPHHRLDINTTRMWLEYNLATDRITLSPDGTGATVRCGTDVANACDATGNARGRNAVGLNTAPAGWASVQIPDSLFLTGAPSWWCQEACAWDAQSGIGALGDDMGGTLCKLPAQIRLEGGTCTALSAGAPASPSIGGESVSDDGFGAPN